MRREDVANRLLDLITSGPTQDCRKNAARTMENIFMLAEVRSEAVQRGYHVRLQRLLDAPTTPKIVQKFIASALVQLLEEGAPRCALHLLVCATRFVCSLEFSACFHYDGLNAVRFRAIYVLRRVESRRARIGRRHRFAARDSAERQVAAAALRCGAAGGVRGAASNGRREQVCDGQRARRRRRTGRGMLRVCVRADPT